MPLTDSLDSLIHITVNEDADGVLHICQGIIRASANHDTGPFGSQFLNRIKLSKKNLVVHWHIGKGR